MMAAAYATPTWSIMALAVFGILFLVAATAVVAMLVNKKTRPIGIVFAVLGGGVCCLAALALLSVRRAVDMEQHWEVAAAVEARQEVEAHTRAVEEAWGQSPIQVEEPSPADSMPTDPAATDEGDEAASATDQPPEDEPSSDATDTGDEADTSTDIEPAETGAEDEPAEPDDTAETPDETTNDDSTAPAQDPADTDVRPATALDPSDTGGARPEWLDIEPGYVDGIYRIAVRTDPLPTPQECRATLPGKLQEAVDTFARTQLGFSWRMHPEDIQRQLVKQQRKESVEVSMGTWVRLHVLIEIDGPTSDAMRRQYEEAKQELVVVERIVLAVVGLAVVLAILTVLFVCLRTDQKTEGKYRGRLGFAAVVVVLIVLAVAARFRGFVHWDYIRPAQQRMAESGVQADGTALQPTYSVEGQQDRSSPRPGARSSNTIIRTPPYSIGTDQASSAPGRYGTSPDSTIIETPYGHNQEAPPYESTSPSPPEYYDEQDASQLQLRTDWSLAIGVPIVLIFLGGIVALVINRRTRVAGAVVLAVGVAMLAVLAVVVG